MTWPCLGGLQIRGPHGAEAPQAEGGITAVGGPLSAAEVGGRRQGTGAAAGSRSGMLASPQGLRIAGRDLDLDPGRRAAAGGEGVDVQSLDLDLDPATGDLGTARRTASLVTGAVAGAENEGHRAS